MAAAQERRAKAFTDTSKSYGLMALAEGSSPAVNRAPEQTVMTWPRVIIVELALFMGLFAVMLVLAMLFDAPLKEIANPDVPENPAKAPWYFLGLQELVSYSAFVGGILVPGVVVAGLALIPYLDTEQGHVGRWFSGAAGRRVATHSALFGLLFTIAVVAFTVSFGWLRTWFPAIPQLVIIALNPGTIIVAGVVGWSLWVMRRTGSRRMGAIAVFTFFLVGFAVLTYVAVFLRGPNWAFYWSSSQWPGVH